MGYPIYHSAYTAAQIEAAIGKGPRVNTSGYWEVWNVGTGAYESTGVGAGVTPPTVVTQAADMTNHGYIYIYNGTETGYTAGYWYYWDGSAWTAGGAYQVAATDTTLTVAGAAADAKATGDKLGEIKSALFEHTVDFENVEIDQSSSVWTVEPNKYISPNGGLVDYTSATHEYKTFYSQFNGSFSFYIDSGFAARDVIIGVYSGAPSSSTFIQRYRSSDNSLPTSENPISVQDGYVIGISLQDDFNFRFIAISGFPNEWHWSGELHEGVALSSENIEQIKNANIIKSPLYVYSDQAGENYTEKIVIYIPAKVGFVGIDFLHNVVPTINANVWRIDRAYAVNDALQKRFDITTTGEWECAVKLSGRSDFSGGIAHGDEIMQSVAFIVDGSKVQTSDLPTVPTNFSQISIIEQSNLYDPNDSETLIALHGSEHIFNSDGIKIGQSLTWKVSETLGNTYLAMLPIAKTASTNMFTNKDFNIIPTVNNLISRPLDSVTLFNDNGVKTIFGVNKYPNLNSSRYFEVSDNSSPNYNKCYYAITATADTITSSDNELWQAESEYHFEIGT